MKSPIYLDSHATTPCDPRVVEAMLPTFTRQFGNAASRNHRFGWEAEALVDKAREQVGALINANGREIVFTSGATESDNLAIKGVAGVYGGKGRHIVTSAVEHSAVLDTCRHLEREGFRVTYLPVDSEGIVRLSDLEAALTSETILVSIMFANNEIGTINPIAEIGALCRSRGVLFHTDAVQALPYEKIDVAEMNIDLLSISAHKMYGPKGIGALYVPWLRSPRVRLAPMIHGGGHERGMRSGTLPVSSIVGLGKACEIVSQQRVADCGRIRAMRDRLVSTLTEALDGVQLNGSAEHRLPNNANVSFAGVDNESLMSGMKDVAVSSGSACTSASQEASYVLKALGIGDERAHSAIRFGLSRFTTNEEIDVAAAQCISTALKLKSMSPLTMTDAPAPAASAARA